mmetsp:Transcript_27108/g.55217  ORF Transcript_27108/g.55217 Transcript_27108/m.55217 type:complete len:403 (+) Transcript_27108:130-1338(+)
MMRVFTRRGRQSTVALSTSLAILCGLLLLANGAMASPNKKPFKMNHPRPPLLANADSEDNSEPAPVRTASKESRLDPANFVVVLVAAVVLIYAANRALRPPYVDVGGMSADQAAEYQEAIDAGEMHLHTTILFVIVASVALVLIFYFMSAMSILITVLFSLIASLALGALVYPYVDRWTDNRFSNEIEVPCLGPVPTLFFVLAPFCIVIVFGWLVTKSWVLNNILAISLIIFFLTSIRLSSLMVASALLILAFFYDIFWVFLSSAIFGKNVMVTVATGLDVPIKILVPLFLSSGPSGEQQFTLIGLGDIVLPGLLLCYAMRFDDAKGCNAFSTYFACTMAGYCVGLTICEVVVGSFHLAQPAMIYLVPGTLIPFFALAAYRGELQEAWDGLKSDSHSLIPGP